MLPAPLIVTVTSAKASPVFGAVARMMAEPTPMPVTGTLTVLVPAPISIVCGTAATAGLLELSVTLRPPGDGGPDNTSSKLSVTVRLIERLAWEKIKLNPFSTVVTAVFKPMALAVMVTVPTPPMPITFGCAVGWVWPRLNKRF